MKWPYPQVLPEDKQAEVLDFVEYLAERFRVPAEAEVDDWSERDYCEYHDQRNTLRDLAFFASFAD